MEFGKIYIEETSKNAELVEKMKEKFDSFQKCDSDNERKVHFYAEICRYYLQLLESRRLQLEEISKIEDFLNKLTESMKRENAHEEEREKKNEDLGNIKLKSKKQQRKFITKNILKSEQINKP